MIHRLTNVPMNKENFKEELDRIHVIAKNRGYTRDLINNIPTFEKKTEI